MLPKILDIDVDWKLGWSNEPELRVLISRIPMLDELEFERDEKGIYWAVLGDYVTYYFHKDPPEEPDKGFGGRVYEIKMKGGQMVRLAGPWSSRAGCVNENFMPTLDVSLTDDPRVMKNGYSFFAGCVTLEAVNWWLLKKCRQISTLWGMRRKVDDQGEVVWIPKRLDGGDCPICKGFKKIPPFVTHRAGEEMIECTKCQGMGSVRHGMEDKRVDREKSNSRADDERASGVGHQVLTS